MCGFHLCAISGESADSVGKAEKCSHGSLYISVQLFSN